ncbi:hypothetical protein Moror_15528 [Moniliophthora roreri MCA 2997]|uniref:Fungal-type protein kinase domain-containing protein n=1 Tax=Moniliophthora roreri (strain MCA 2997) TaxID=1381753 RepID=V2W1I5_MONRO|nr:hypothetical protein Moror_15528 [Moniliophthora roreri MCA 2997]
MEEVRNQALYDLGPRIPEVSFDQFKAAVLLHVDNAKLEQVYDALKKDGELSDEGWIGFKFDKAKSQRVRRVPVQGQAEQSGQGQVRQRSTLCRRKGRIPRVLEHTQEATGKPPLITFSSTPSKGLKSEDAHGGYIADINALLVDTAAVGDQAGKEQFECDIVMTGEFKKVVNDSDIDDNISKLVGNINHLMGSDPTRGFAYGLTIEHNDTRFWFCSRSHIFVTEQLDLQKNIKDVIYFVMALGSASKEQLGFDPTVRRIKRSSGSSKHLQGQVLIG